MLVSHARGSTDSQDQRSLKENEFLFEIGKQGGPMEEAFNYLKGKGLLPSVPVSL